MKPPFLHGHKALFLVLTLSAATASLPGQPGSTNTLGPVDFRYALPWWQTLVCLPDDPDKAIVGKEGQFLFDFGGGGVRNFGLCVQPDIEGGTKWFRQQTLTPRVPIVQTWKEINEMEVVESAFVVPTKTAETNQLSRLTRIEGNERLKNWAKPARPCAEAFTGADVSYNGKPIQLRFVQSTSRPVTVVFGLCEGWHKQPGKRPLVLRVEGGSRREVDPVKDFGVNEPGLYTLQGSDVNGDGYVDISVATPVRAEDRNAILNALWVFEDPPPADEFILKGEASATAVFGGNGLPTRQSILLMTLRNRAPSATVTCRPLLHISSVEPPRYEAEQRCIVAGENTRILCSETIESCALGTDAEFLVKLPALLIGPGKTRQVAFTLLRNSKSTPQAIDPDTAQRDLEGARKWWEGAGLPFDTIEIPDPSVQAMIESCVRNIWQAREIKGGKPAFHVGPTVYRGLWVVDGSFLLESAAILGRGQDARAGVEYLLSHQKPDGSFEILPRFWKENGIVLWAVTRHALLTQDRRWLRDHWPAVLRVLKAIQRLRAEASKDPAALDYRLLPAGDVDGGISNRDKPEYSNTYWTLAGLKAAASAARWLEDESSAAQFQREFDDLYGVYRKAAKRDTLRDPAGNAYVPTMMGDADHHAPARGQWAFCHAVYPGQVFPASDPLVEGQLAMLRATKVEGMVYDTGWMKEGIWTYFASFYGHAQLWQGRGNEAAQVLYAFANHACPTRVWREEQKPVGKGNQEVGDMPHNWASAEFIRLTTHLLEIDRGDELHLLEGIPDEWLKPGMTTRLNGVLTPFGPLHMKVTVDADGSRGRLDVQPLRSGKTVVVHLPDGSTRSLPPHAGGSVTFDLHANAK